MAVAPRLPIAFAFCPNAVAPAFPLALTLNPHAKELYPRLSGLQLVEAPSRPPRRAPLLTLNNKNVSDTDSPF